ncbi:hypothetical protein [Nocardia salmonicida]|uniref:hypothetical protein n=1 Tax=Nocardia salmonicida TaxID=53431 RepID=UPI000AF7A1D2|nr:hypothetical protein [Nocardia salmonicida]
MLGPLRTNKTIRGIGMGFRTVVISEDLPYALPTWLIEAHPELHFGNHGDGSSRLPIASRFERKFYDSKDDQLFLDLQRVLNETPSWSHNVELILFHECGGITKVLVTRDQIRMAEPTGWSEVDEIDHWFCGCSFGTQIEPERSEPEERSLPEIGKAVGPQSGPDGE